MKQNVKIVLIASFLCFTCLFTSCGGNKATSKEPYLRAPMKVVSYDMDAFMSLENSGIFVENVSDGYVCAYATGEKRIKFQVEAQGQRYNYDLNSSGKVEVFPLQMGNGTYSFTLFENVENARYVQLLNTTTDVELSDEFEPFLHSNQIVNFNDSDSLVKLTDEITGSASTEEEVVELIYKYIIGNIGYDIELAATVQSGYIPNLDSLLQSKKGICFDYAALCAAMLRSQGIPAKVVTGYVSSAEIYHAWNMIYLKDGGWKYKKITIDKNKWGRVDPTFDAAAKSAGVINYVGDASSYSDKFIY